MLEITKRNLVTIYPEKTLEFISEVLSSNPSSSHANLDKTLKFLSQFFQLKNEPDRIYLIR